MGVGSEFEFFPRFKPLNLNEFSNLFQLGQVPGSGFATIQIR